MGFCGMNVVFELFVAIAVNIDKPLCGHVLKDGSKWHFLLNHMLKYSLCRRVLLNVTPKITIQSI